MTREGQRSVTIPEDTWKLAEEYFKKNQKDLEQYNIKSVSGLINWWVKMNSRAVLKPLK